MHGGRWDAEMLTAYYCFVNLGWPPSQYDRLPYGEKLLVTQFALKAINDQREAEEKLKRR
ncbi:MAG: hypothetical protein KHW65_10845 [Clostridiales bacterium]|nr:hypothetical protein [Clostridiales bacterium]